MDQQLLSNSIAAIEREYEERGLSDGWRFLYSQSSTFTGNARLWFFGLNPGGGKPEEHMPSCENGSAYRVERWGSNGTLNKLQVQVHAFFEQLASRLSVDRDTLMDSTLKSNITPFRTRSERDLQDIANREQFTHKLWRPIVQAGSPAVIVAMSNSVFHFFQKQLSDLHSVTHDLRESPVGWGSVKWASNRFSSGGSQLLLVGIPHLSRFTIFSRKESAEAASNIVDQIASALSQHRWPQD